MKTWNLALLLLLALIAVPALAQDGHEESGHEHAEAGAGEEEMTDEMRAAIEFLQVELADGSRPATEIEDKAKELGIKKTTLDRAKKRIGVKLALKVDPHDSARVVFPR